MGGLRVLQHDQQGVPEPVAVELAGELQPCLPGLRVVEGEDAVAELGVKLASVAFRASAAAARSDSLTDLRYPAISRGLPEGR